MIKIIVALTAGTLLAVGIPLLAVGGPEAAPNAASPPSQESDLEAQGYERILRQDDSGRFSKHGWNHYGPGWFELDRETGILTAHGGMGLLWYSAERYGDFVLELDFMTSEENANSGIFLRVPEVPTSDEYIYRSFEIQIHDAPEEGVHTTGAVYDAEPPTTRASKGPGVWNHLEITFRGDRIQVELNGTPVLDWQAEPRGKIRDFAPRGYVGLQNHDWDTEVSFRNIFVKKLD